MYQTIAKEISNNKRGFRKRFRILLGLLSGVGIAGAVLSKMFPKERSKVIPFLEIYRYFFTFGVILAMGALMKKKHLSHKKK